MLPERLTQFINEHRALIDDALLAHLPVSCQSGAERLNDAICYAVFPGGKRVRPVLTLLGAMSVGGHVKQALSAACAVEFLHTSSLILDDMPAMDDAKFRRGQKSLHVAFGESLALLASLALLNKSYELFAVATGGNRCDRLINEATTCIGVNGMIGGQAADLSLQNTGDKKGLLDSRVLKTTALMRLTMLAGAIVCGSHNAQEVVLARYGENLGVAYQIRDDLLDAEEDCKSCSSFVFELGEQGAHEMASRLIEEGKRGIEAQFGNSEAALLLADFADGILSKVESLVLSTRA